MAGPDSKDSAVASESDARPTTADDAAAASETRASRRAADRRKKGTTRKKVISQLAELPVLVLIAFAIAVVIKTFLVQAFYIPSGSMLPALRVGDRVLVEKVSYRVTDPGRGQVVVFARSVFGRGHPNLPWDEDAKNFFRELLGLPTGGEQDYIKRVVAVGGDSVLYKGKPRRLIVNGERVKEPYLEKADGLSEDVTLKDCKSLKMPADEDGCRVPAGQVFVMGDNRRNSEDSRFPGVGPIGEDKIVGRAFAIVWPPSDFGGV